MSGGLSRRVEKGTVQPMRYPFIVPVNGVSFRQDAALRVRRGDSVDIRRQPDNPHDPQAMAIFLSATGDHLGYMPAPLARRIADDHLVGHIDEVLGGATRGLRVKVTGVAAEEADSVPEGASLESHAPAAASEVFTRSGRLLGTFVSAEGGKVTVATPAGEVSYPEKVVVVSQAESA